MPLFAVRYEHPDAAGWQEQLVPHIRWLQDRLRDGSLIASGPLTDAADKAALLIMAAEHRAAVDAIIATDPFAEHGLIAHMTIHAWDPIFGAFNDRSSMPGQMQGD